MKLSEDQIEEIVGDLRSKLKKAIGCEIQRKWKYYEKLDDCTEEVIHQTVKEEQIYIKIGYQ